MSDTYATWSSAFTTEELLFSLIGRPPSTFEDQKEAIARHAAGGFRALDLSIGVREAIALVECRRRPANTNWISFVTMKTWGRSYSIHVANEIRLSRREVTSAYYLLRSMETRGLMRCLPRQKTRPRSSRPTLEWEITDLGRARLAELLASLQSCPKSEPLLVSGHGELASLMEPDVG